MVCRLINDLSTSFAFISLAMHLSGEGLHSSALLRPRNEPELAPRVPLATPKVGGGAGSRCGRQNPRYREALPSRYRSC